jgi:antitoxin VapB
VKIAKVFIHGNSQAVRIPKEFRLAVSEVVIEKSGDALILKPKQRDRWANFKRSLDMFEGRIERNQPKRPETRDWLGW